MRAGHHSNLNSWQPPASPLSAEVIVMSPCTGQSPAYCVLSKPFAPVLVVFTDEEFEALGEIKA